MFFSFDCFSFSLSQSQGASLTQDRGVEDIFETNMFESEGGGPNPISRVNFSVSKDDNWSIHPAHSRCSVPATTPLTLETLFGTISR